MPVHKIFEYLKQKIMYATRTDNSNNNNNEPATSEALVCMGRLEDS